MGPNKLAYARIREGRNGEKSIPLMTNDPKTIRLRASEVRMLESLIKNKIPVKLSWLADENKVSRPKPTIQEAFEQFILLKISDGLAVSTISEYRTTISHFSKCVRMSRPASSILLKDIEAFKIYLIDQGLAPATVNRRLREIHSYIRWLYDHERLRRAYSVKQLSEPEKINYISEKHLTNILKFIPEHLVNIYLLYADTGMRLREPFNANIIGHTLVIDASKSKNRKRRTVRLNDDQVQVWHKLRSLPYSPKYYSVLFKKAARQAQLGRHRFHDLRHHFAVKSYFKYRDIFHVSKLMSHSSVSVTERYQVFTFDELEADFPSISATN
jgi:site-specific recombinase XerD